MSTETIITAKRPEEVRQLVDRFGRMIAGQEQDRYGLADCFWSAVAHSLATSIHKAFLLKSAHGKDDLGNSWPDHNPKTKAYSRPDARIGLSLPGPKRRPTLTNSQDKAWRYIFASQLAYYRTQMSEKEAKILAAKQAWSTVKKQLGATTLLELTRDMLLPLLQKEGTLINSLAPGLFSGEKYIPPDNQVFRTTKNSLTWGTKVKYANRVSVKRPIWPASMDPWMSRALGAGADAVYKKLKELVV